MREIDPKNRSRVQTARDILLARIDYLSDRMQTRGQDFDDMVRELRAVNRQLKDRMDDMEKREGSLKKLLWTAMCATMLTLLTRPDLPLLGMINAILP